MPISDEAMDFISCLLKVNPSERVTACEGQLHPWFSKAQLNKRRSEISTSFISDSLLRKQNLTKVQQFIRQVVQVGGKKVHPFLTRDLDNLFQKYDEEKNGWLTWGQFRKAVDDFAEDHEHVSHEDVAALFEQIDTTNSGQIAYEDMVSWMTFQHLSTQDDRVWDAVMSLDHNRNGRVSIGDVETFLQVPALRAKLSADTVQVVQETVKEGSLDYMQFIQLMEGPESERGTITPER